MGVRNSTCRQTLKETRTPFSFTCRMAYRKDILAKEVTDLLIILFNVLHPYGTRKNNLIRQK